MLIWAPIAIGGRWEGAVLGASLLLSLTVPLALALLTLRKVFFALGSAALGLVAIVAGVGAPLGVAPSSSSGSPVASSAFGMPLGIALPYLAYRILRRAQPFYGFR